MRYLLCVACVAALAACGGSNNSSNDAGGETVDGGTVDCSADPRVSAYAPNMSVQDSAGDRTYVLMQSTPAPPSRGNNTWQVKVTDASGQPLDGLDLGATAFMPDHGHGAGAPVVTDQGQGVYQLQPLYFFMPGVWRVTLNSADGGAGEAGAFWFCVEG